GPSLGHQIISSQLDADRLDYLLRDAHFTGVAYGRYDLEWLLHSLQVRWVGVGGREAPRLCVETGKGPAALENYLHARDHMYRQVYDHKTVRGFEALLIHLFHTLERFRREFGTFPPGTPPPLARFLESLSRAGGAEGDDPGAVERYVALDDAVLEYAFAQWAAQAAQAAQAGEAAGRLSPWEALLAHQCRLLVHRKPVYRRMSWRTAAGGVSELIPDAATVGAVAQWLDEEGERRIPAALTGGRRELPLALLVRMDEVEHAPYHGLQYDAQAGNPIHVVDAGGRVARAEEVSDPIKLMSASPRRTAWLFVDPAAWEAVRGLMAGRFDVAP
ncbi:MAG: hypothetical protein HQL51_00720, partial [Magnetococcales bacterium]|nr:hypothetical protein [Magnetococcales bacterium]